MIKPGTYVDMFNISNKVVDFDLKNESRNSKIDELIKWFIMGISNEAEPP